MPRIFVIRLRIRSARRDVPDYIWMLENAAPVYSGMWDNITGADEVLVVAEKPLLAKPPSPRMLRGLLAAEGCKIGRRHVTTLMRRMGGRSALSPSAYDEARAGPTRSTRICCAEWRSRGRTRCGRWTSPTSRWHAALSIWLVVLDWFSRRVLAWRLSITMEATFCIEALEDALARHGKPEICNTDQGSQFTGVAFTGVLSLPSTGVAPRS